MQVSSVLFHKLQHPRAIRLLPEKCAERRVNSIAGIASSTRYWHGRISGLSIALRNRLARSGPSQPAAKKGVGLQAFLREGKYHPDPGHSVYLRHWRPLGLHRGHPDPDRNDRQRCQGTTFSRLSSRAQQRRKINIIDIHTPGIPDRYLRLIRPCRVIPDRIIEAPSASNGASSSAGTVPSRAGGSILTRPSPSSSPAPSRAARTD